MGAIVRRLLDPEFETEITCREVPVELEGGGISKRLKGWAFEGPEGDPLGTVVVHRTENLGTLTEPELELLYLYALEHC
jgi:hypothetical protein